MPISPRPRPGSLRARAELHRALSASKRAESRYTLDLQAVMRRTHASILAHVVPGVRGDSRRLDADSDARFLRRLFVLQRPDVQRAFDRMAKDAKAASAKGAALVGIPPGDVPGLDAVLAEARENNVRLIRSASEDFLAQVRAVLEEFAGLHPGKGAGPKRLATLLRAPAPDHEPEEPRDLTEALQARVGVSRSRANLIARDQAAKTTAALNKHRQQAAGVRQFRWSASMDERTRPAHRALNGRVFSWDEGLPPDVADEVGEEAGALPSTPVNCRCVALPMLGVLGLPQSAGAEAVAPEGEDYGQAAE